MCFYGQGTYEQRIFFFCEAGQARFGGLLGNVVRPVPDARAGSGGGFRCARVVGKVDVDKCPELAQQFGVMSIPTLILFKDGQVVDTLVGYHPKAALEDLIKKAL